MGCNFITSYEFGNHHLMVTIIITENRGFCSPLSCIRKWDYIYYFYIQLAKLKNT